MLFLCDFTAEASLIFVCNKSHYFYIFSVCNPVTYFLTLYSYVAFVFQLTSLYILQNKNDKHKLKLY